MDIEKNSKYKLANKEMISKINKSNDKVQIVILIQATVRSNLAQNCQNNTQKSTAVILLC